MNVRIVFLASMVAPAAFACGTSSSSGERGGVPLGDGGGFVDAGGEPDGAKPLVDGGYEGPDGGILRADRFVTKVESFMPGDCAGFGMDKMPDVVYGPPVGGGALQGSLDVVSLGQGGEIVLSFGSNAIVDGPGPDFIVFENAFYAGGDPERPVADLGEVGVSADGVTWKTYPCTVAKKPPYGACAGWHPVYSAPGNGISPVDPKTAGGEAYDLSELGLSEARFVRIRDMKTGTCDVQPKPTTLGFDLDAIAIVNAKIP